MENILQIGGTTMPTVVEELLMILINNEWLTPYIVMTITLFFTKIQNKKSLQQQEIHHQSTLKQQEIHHQNTLKQQENHYIETQKISKKQFLNTIMPVFQLERNIKITEKNGDKIINLQLKNIGNGVATNVDIIYEENNSIVFCDSPSPPNKTYYYHDYLYDNIFRINESHEFSLLLKYDSTNSVMDILSTCGKCEFSIEFTDTELNKYTQKFSFVYNTTDEAYELRITNGKPKLISEIFP